MRQHVYADIYGEAAEAMKKKAALLRVEEARLNEWRLKLEKQEAAFEQTLEEAKERAQRAVIASLNGMIASWGDDEIKLDRAGTWHAKSGLQPDRLSLLALWHKYAGDMAASIVRRFEAVLGPLERELKLKLAAGMKQTVRSSGVDLDTSR
jgi:hypothetical protein